MLTCSTREMETPSKFPRGAPCFGYDQDTKSVIGEYMEWEIFSELDHFR